MAHGRAFTHNIFRVAPGTARSYFCMIMPTFADVSIPLYHSLPKTSIAVYE